MEVFIKNNGLGNIVRGTIYDCSKKVIERQLRDYDKQLYLKWNPLKTILSNGKTYFLPPEGMYWKGYGMGCWELRRRPNEKTAVPTWQIGDSIVFNLEYRELDIINCIKDFRHLDYSIVKWVQDHDGWNVKDYAKELEYQEDKSYDKALDQSQSDLRYAIKHERRAMRDFQDEIKSGKSPLEFLGGAWNHK